MEIKQIRSQDGTGTLSYLVFAPESRAGILIDPNREDLSRLRETIASTGVRLTHVIDTHTHADHISAAGELREIYGASVVMHENTKHKWRVVDQGDRFGIGDILRANAAIKIDQYVSDGDEITSDGITITALFTPGHTDNHLSLIAGENLFTGDLLLIGQAGRSDLPGGNPEQQYDSLFLKILPLRDSYKMYPGHDYAGNVYALLGDEKQSNPFLQRRSKAQYLEFVKEFFPPIAESIASGEKMTLQCGTTRVAEKEEAIGNISPADLDSMDKDGVLLLDVREPSELAMIGHIDGVINIPIGQLARRLGELPADKNAPIVCICQSGSRSREATHLLLRNGYTGVKNLNGGTSAWMKSGRSVVRDNAPVRSTSGG